MKTDFKFTKGKWYVCCLKNTPHFVFGEKSGLTICKPYREQEMLDDLPLDEFRANALLISKAPEMLYLLKDLLHDKGLNEVSRREVELLIRQATEI